MSDMDEIAQELVDLGMAGVEGLAGKLITSFPKIPHPDAARAMITVILAQHIGEGVQASMELLVAYTQVLSD